MRERRRTRRPWPALSRSGPSPKTPTGRREKTRVERSREAGAQGLVRGGVDASGRYAGSMTERVPGDSTRRAPTLAAARPSREHPSWVMLARIVPGHGRFTPSVVRRPGLARRRRRASRVGQRMVRCGYVPRLDIFLECYTEAATRRVPKRANGPSVSRFSNRVQVQTHSASSGFRKSGQMRITAYRGTKHAFECIKIASIYQQTCYSSPHLSAVRFAPA